MAYPLILCLHRGPRTNFNTPRAGSRPPQPCIQVRSALTDPPEAFVGMYVMYAGLTTRRIGW